MSIMEILELVPDELFVALFYRTLVAHLKDCGFRRSSLKKRGKNPAY